MPPLYRMPVFYLAVLVLGGIAVGLGGRKPKVVDEVSIPTPIKPPPIPSGPVVEAFDGDRSDGILRTSSGVRRKVVVKVLGQRCRSEPDGGVTVGPTLDYFSIHFVFGESGPSLQIGPAKGPPIGWIPGDSAFEWDTRLMALPTLDASRPALDVHRDFDPGSPIVGSEPHPPQPGDPTPVLGLPVLRSETRDDRTAFQVAALVRETLPPPPPTVPPEDLRLALRRVYIAFALDTTSSMGRAIEAVRRVVSEIGDDRSPRYRGLSLKVGLVEYRDADPNYPRVTPFVAPSELRAALARVEAAKQGDGTIPEAVFAGLNAALDPDKMGWPTGAVGDASTKLLVLIGDAPDHAVDLDVARSIAEKANQQHITIAAVAIDTPFLSRSESTLYRDQWRTLAENSYRPIRDQNGLRQPLPPILPVVTRDPSLGEAAVEAIEGPLQALIDDRVHDALRIAQERQEEVERSLKEYADSRARTLDRYAPILVDLHRGEPKPEYHADPRFQGSKAPSVRLGWIADRRGSTPLLSLQILMTRAELTLLIDELESFAQAAEGASDLASLRRIGTAAVAGETAFLASDRGSLTFSAHLGRLGFPPPRPGGLLGRTQAELLKADPLYREELRARLRAVLPGLDRIRTSPDWDDPGKTVEGMMLVPYELLDL